MNERIRELLVESNNALTRNGKIYPHIGSRTLEDWEKFAELIVRECAQLVQGVPTDTMGYHTADQKIKQHFGVE